MNTTVKLLRNWKILDTIKKRFFPEGHAYQDDLIVHSGREAILEIANEVENKNIAVVIHLANGLFIKATIVKVLNGAHVITEESSFLSTKASLFSIQEIRSVSTKAMR
jgi:hypothetical protein